MTVNKRLNQIVWQRYKWFVALFVALIVGAALLNTVGSINSVRETEKMTTYQHFVTDTKANAKENKIKADVSQSEYKKYQANMGYDNTSTLAGSNGWPEIFILLMVGVGLFTSLYDGRTKFNEFIFSSRFSRRRYFWKRTGLLLGSTLITILICMLADISIAKELIPNTYFNISISFFVLKLMHYLAAYIAVYTVGVIVGVLVNGVLAATVTAVGFLGTWTLFTGAFLNNNFGNPFSYTSKYDIRYIGLSIPVQIGLFLVLGGLILWLASYFFNKLSLEQDGPYLQFNYLKRPLLIFVTLYIGLIIGRQGFDYTKINEMIKAGLIAGIITFVISYIVIYRPQNVWQKIQNWFSKK